MKRFLVLVVLAGMAGSAEAQIINLGSGDNRKHKSKSGNEPPPLGPWYNYWPLEAHFQIPAMPEYPFFSAPQTLPVVPPAPYQTNQGFGMGGYPGANPYGYGAGYPGAMPYANTGGMQPGGMQPGGTNPSGQQSPANPPANPMQPGGPTPARPGSMNMQGGFPYSSFAGYPGYSGYPNYGYGYPGYGYGYPGMFNPQFGQQPQR